MIEKILEELRKIEMDWVDGSNPGVSQELILIFESVLKATSYMPEAKMIIEKAIKQAL